jgi:hypothetical protein
MIVPLYIGGSQRMDIYSKLNFTVAKTILAAHHGAFKLPEPA